MPHGDKPYPTRIAAMRRVTAARHEKDRKMIARIISHLIDQYPYLSLHANFLIFVSDRYTYGHFTQKI